MFGVAVALLLRYERRRLVDLIAANPPVDVDPAVLASLPSARARRKLRRAARRSGGRAAGKAVKRQQRDALDLLQSPADAIAAPEPVPTT